MFEQVSFPFANMTQGVLDNGLGFIAEKRSESFRWLWWILLPILLLLSVFLLLARQHKKKVAEQKKIAEEQEKQKLLDQ